MNNNTILVTGAQGQLGQTLEYYWAASELAREDELLFYDIGELDLTLTNMVEEELNRIKPRTILNAAAYTAVDQAETDQEAAFLVNALAVANLADWAARNDCFMVHISTDFVFDGRKRSPYLPEDEVSPLGVYGASKLAGEVALQSSLPDGHAIIRTSWLYSEYGKNFVTTILRLIKEKDEIGVVADQVGSPTSTHSLVALLLRMRNREIDPGIYHWTDGASISWYEFAGAIQAEGIRQGVLETGIPLKPLTTADYPTPATRPAYSVLDRSKTLTGLQVDASNWEQELRRVIKRIATSIEK